MSPDQQFSEIQHWLEEHPLPAFLRLGLDLVKAGFETRRKFGVNLLELSPQLHRSTLEVVKLLAQFQQLHPTLTKLGFRDVQNVRRLLPRKTNASAADVARIEIPQDVLERLVLSCGANPRKDVTTRIAAQQRIVASRESSGSKLPPSTKPLRTGPGGPGPNFAGGSAHLADPSAGQEFLSESTQINQSIATMTARPTLNEKKLEELFAKQPVRAARQVDFLNLKEVHCRADVYKNVSTNAAVIKFVAFLTSKLRSQIAPMMGPDHAWEWILLIDCSGSMLGHMAAVRLAAIVLMEAFRSLELPFSVYGFKKQPIKLYDVNESEGFTPAVGQRVLQGLEFQGGTEVATCIKSMHAFEAFREKHKSTPHKHCMMTMVSDCFSSQTQTGEYQEEFRKIGLNFSCLAIGQSTNETLKRFLGEITGRWSDAGREDQQSCFQIASEADEGRASPVKVIMHSRLLLEKQLEIEFNAPRTASTVASSPDVLFSKVDAEDGIPSLTKTEISCEGSGALFISRTSAVSLDLDSRNPRDLVSLDLSMLERLKVEQFGDATPHPAARNNFTSLARALSVPIEETRVALAEIFTMNRFTMMRPARRGPSISIRGLIRTLMTNYTDLRFFAARTAGGRRDYAVCVCIDNSLSMKGEPHRRAIATCVILCNALHAIGVQKVSVVAYGKSVRLIKAPSREWSDAALPSLLGLTGDDPSSNDAAGLAVALRLVTNAKKATIFNISDGFSSTSEQLKEVLLQAQRQGVEVTGLMSSDIDVNLPNTIGRYLVVSHPRELASGLRVLYSNVLVTPYPISRQVEMEFGAELDGSVATELESPQLGESLYTSELEQQQSSNAGNVDVCFVVDLTSSMTPFIDQLRKYMDDLALQLTNCNALKASELRFGLIGFRDYGDAVGPTLNFSTKADFSKWVLAGGSLVTQGGTDIAEDVVGGLQRALDLFKTQSKTKNRFLIFLGDGPQHGKQYHDLPTDRFPQYPASAPNGAAAKTLEVMVDELAAESIYFFGCSIRKELTEKMFNAIHTRYPTPKGDTKQCNIETTVFNSQTSGKYHFVFALDESGSMRIGVHDGRFDWPIPAGKEVRWTGLLKAFWEFVRTAQAQSGQESQDLITVFTHDESTRCQINTTSLSSISEATQQITPKWGDNNFDVVLQNVEPSLSLRLDEGYIPVLVFMSDGGDCGDREAAYATMKRIVDSIPAMQVISILAFDTQEEENCRKLAEQAGPRGSFTPIENDVAALVKKFTEIATKFNSAEKVVEQLSQEVVNSVVTAVALSV